MSPSGATSTTSWPKRIRENQVVLGSERTEVVEDLVVPGIGRQVLGEREVLVGGDRLGGDRVRRGVDRASRVGAVPDAAHVVMGLQHLERDAFGLEVARRRETGRSGSDDGVRQCRIRSFDPPRWIGWFAWLVDGQDAPAPALIHPASLYQAPIRVLIEGEHDFSQNTTYGGARSR